MLRGKTPQRAPVETPKLWVGVGERALLVQYRQERCEGSGFCATAQVKPAVLNGAQGIDDEFFDGLIFRGQANGRETRQSNHPRAEVAARRRGLESQTPGQGIALRLVDPHQHFFLCLVRDRWRGATLAQSKIPRLSSLLSDSRSSP